MEVALEQGGVNDLQQLLLGFDGRCAFHKWGGARLVIRVIQLLYQLASFLPRPKNVGLRPGLNHPYHLGHHIIFQILPTQLMPIHPDLTLAHH